VVGILHCAFLKVRGDADIVMRTEDETGSFALEKIVEWLRSHRETLPAQ